VRTIDSAPKDGTIIGVWCYKDRSVIRIVRWGIAKMYPKAGECWVTEKGSAISHIPTHWIEIQIPAEEDQQ